MQFPNLNSMTSFTSAIRSSFRSYKHCHAAVQDAMPENEHAVVPEVHLICGFHKCFD